MTKNSYYVIRVKDRTGDVIKYISDYPPDIDDDGNLEIITGTGVAMITVTYSMEHVIYWSIEEKEDSDGLNKIKEDCKIESYYRGNS